MIDRYIEEYECVQRLHEEYKQYGSIIIAYDFDDTIFDFHGRGDSYTKVVELLRRWKKLNARFICFTGRSDVEYIKQYLNDNNIPVDLINENFPETNFPGRKIYANIYLDDRAGLSSAYATLCHVEYILKSES